MIANELTVCEMICELECIQCLEQEMCPADTCRECIWRQRFEHNDCEWNPPEKQEGEEQDGKS